MSELLSGLRTYFLGDDGLMHKVTSERSARYAPVGPWLLGSDVREALSNPTDEQVGEFVGVVSRHTVTWDGAYRCPTCGPLMFDGPQDAVFHPFRMAFAAAAGGEHE